MRFSLNSKQSIQLQEFIERKLTEIGYDEEFIEDALETEFELSFDEDEGFCSFASTKVGDKITNKHLSISFNASFEVLF